MIKKTVSAIILSALTFGAIIYLDEWALDAIVLLLVMLGIVEYASIFIKDFVLRWCTVVMAMAIASMILFSPACADALGVMLVATMFCSFFAVMWRSKELSGTAELSALMFLGICYIGFAFPYWGLIARFSEGRSFVLLALLPACLCDTFAYIFGKSLGRRRFAPMVSPNKTWEGYFGALIGSLVGSFLIWALMLRSLPIWQIVIFAIMIWIVSPIGDLIESMLKRSAGVKDSGNLIPGHGGILDRLDALIFTGPAAFAFIKFVIMK